jgi:hypothetical protein
MKVYGKEFKKAKLGKSIEGKKFKQLTDFGNPPIAQTGTTESICGPGFKWDDFTQSCVIDPEYDNVPKPNSPAIVSSIVNQTKSAFPNFNLRTNPTSLDGMQMFDLPVDMQMGIEDDLRGQKEPDFNPFGNKKPELPVNLPETPALPKMKGLDKMGGAAAVGQAVGDVIGGIGIIRDERRRMKELKQQKRVTDVMRQAASSMDASPIKRRYARPEDVAFSPEQLYPSYGTGSNILTMKKGGSVHSGNPTEIKNTYTSPTTLYTDLEEIPTGKFGLSEFASQGGGDVLGQLGMYATGGPSGEGKIGGAVGGVAGSLIGGPVGAMIGKGLGSLFGGLFSAGRRAKMKNYQQGIDTNIASISGQQIPQQFNRFMKNGGEASEYKWISHDWVPQKIVKFGDHRVSDLLQPDETMDTLRTGGNLRQNEMFPTDQFNFGGQLQTTWGGHAEPISQNPYLPGSGETVMFRGNSHEESDRKGRTGIGVKYGEDGDYIPYMEYGRDGVENVTDVEVERGEPATEMIDPETGDKNMVVFGNLQIPKMFVEQIGDKNAKGKKFKNYVHSLSKKEARQNKILERASELANNVDENSPFGKIAMNSAEASMFGANMKLKNIADKKMKASIAQSAINDTAEEYGLDADSLAKGKVKIDKEAMKKEARWGAAIEKAQKGITQVGRDAQGFPIIELDESAENPPSDPRRLFKDVDDIANYYRQFGYSGESDIKSLQTWLKDQSQSNDRVKQELATYLKRSDIPLTNYGKRKYKGKSKGQLSEDQLIDQFVDGLWDYRFPKLESLTVPNPVTPREKAKAPKISITPAQPETIPLEKVEAKKRSPYIDAFNALLPYIRPSDAEPLDPRQLYGEMFAMADDVQPVLAQSYQPQLKSIYDISLQDQLNEVTAQARAAERLAGANPAAMASLMGSAAQSRSKILGEQTRINQGNMAGIINDNINTINDARLKNIAMYDTQYGRQEQARSNTRAAKLAALQSMGDKYLQNQLNNRTLQVYENMYNYRFDPQFRAINMNPLFQANIPQVGDKDDVVSSSSGKMSVGSQDYLPIYDDEGNIKGYKAQKEKKSKAARNGSIVKALKTI